MKTHVHLITLFWKFFKIGIFTFGGGYAMIPLIEKEVVENDWIEPHDIVDLVAISQSIPGAVAVNMSLFVGYRIAKVKGAIISVLGCITPSVLIILAIATFMTNIENQAIVQHAFTGILSGVVALILISAIKIAKIAWLDLPTIILSVLTITLLTLVTFGTLTFIPPLLSQFLPIILIVLGAMTGFLFYFLFPKKVRKIMGGKR